MRRVSELDGEIEKEKTAEYQNKSENSERILLDFKLLYFLINIALVCDL